jgi:hypothetical protein
MGDGGLHGSATDDRERLERFFSCLTPDNRFKSLRIFP